MRKTNVLVSHLFFVNDLILCGKATRENGNDMLELLSLFGTPLGEKIDKNKLRIFFSKNTHKSERMKIWERTRMRETEEVRIYLGFFISERGNMKMKMDDLILEKLCKELAR